MSAIFDIDGTLVVKGTRPNDKIIRMCNSRPDSVIITGRLEDTRDETVQMLHKFGIAYRSLLMNNVGPDKADQIASKKHNASTLLAHGPVDLAVDDDAIARSLYKTLGVTKVVGA